MNEYNPQSHWFVSLVKFIAGFAAFLAAIAAILTYLETHDIGIPWDKENGIHQHNFSIKSVSREFMKSEASCSSPAIYYYSCSCGAVGKQTFSNGNAQEHTLSSGWNYAQTEHWRSCINCNSKLQKAVHSYGVSNTCSICGYVNLNIHTHSGHLTCVAAKSSSCIQLGNVSYYTCECGKWFSDSAAKVEIADHSSVLIPAAEHVDRNNDGKCDVCNERTSTITPTQSVKTLFPKGTIIPFGTYNGYSLTWRILDVSDNKYLLLSEGGVSNRGFHTSNDSAITWNTCSLRNWLNNDFYYAAFQPSERNIIQSTKIDGEYSKLYLLSRDETEKYMKTDKERKCYPSSNLDVFREPKENGAGWWMLRTPAKNAATVITVNADGKLDYNEGCSLINVRNRGVVRPAMWVSADYFG